MGLPCVTFFTPVWHGVATSVLVKSVVFTLSKAKLCIWYTYYRYYPKVMNFLRVLNQGKYYEGHFLNPQFPSTTSYLYSHIICSRRTYSSQIWNRMAEIDWQGGGNKVSIQDCGNDFLKWLSWFGNLVFLVPKVWKILHFVPFSQFAYR